MILFLANEPPWPARNGGRARMSGLVEGLRTTYNVDVAVARGPRSEDVPTGMHGLQRCRRSRWVAPLGPGPRLGRGLLDRDAVEEVRLRAAAARAVLVSHSYLAAELGDPGRPVVVDLPNLEVDRQRTQRDPVSRLEATKARRWEPAVVRRAAAVVCVDETDAARARAWGARRVAVVPNISQVPTSGRSPAAGSALAVADWRYGPNRDALRELLDDVWPRVLQQRPDARLVIAGRGSEQVPGGLGFVDDLTPLFDEAAAFVSLVRAGAGTQLKLVEAVARGRVPVTTSYGVRSLPAAARPCCAVGDPVEQLLHLLGDPADRWRREEGLAALDLPRSWAAAVAPLVTVLTEVAGD